jgi:hypothetical protein
MTGCNELRNELKADGAGGARNKNSHGVLLTFVATARQVVGANVKSSVRMWRWRKSMQAAELRSGRGRLHLVPNKNCTWCPNKKGALSARLRCLFDNRPISES